MKFEKDRKKTKNKYSPPKYEKYKVDDLAKEWDLEVVGKGESCPSRCE